MLTVEIRRTINAPIETVFRTVSDIDHFSKAIPKIEKVAIVSDVRSGVGTRFRETRTIRGTEATTELEVTEYVPNERVRLVADSHGTVWDSLFTLKEKEEGVRLKLKMEAHPTTLLARLSVPIVMKMIVAEIERDIDAVKEYCERSGAV